MYKRQIPYNAKSLSTVKGAELKEDIKTLSEYEDNFDNLNEKIETNDKTEEVIIEELDNTDSLESYDSSNKKNKYVNFYILSSINFIHYNNNLKI